MPKLHQVAAKRESKVCATSKKGEREKSDAIV